MKHSKQPRTQKRQSELVIEIVPKEKAAQQHKTLESFDFKPLNEVRASFLEAGYPEEEVNDMIEALSELPQYAVEDLQKSE